MQCIRRATVDGRCAEHRSGSCSAGQPPDQVPARVRESASAATGPHLRNAPPKKFESLDGRYGAELYLIAVAAEKDQRPPARNPYRPNRDENSEDLLRPISEDLLWPILGGYVEAPLSDPIERLSVIR
jgi:hypothetical protein